MLRNSPWQRHPVAVLLAMLPEAIEAPGRPVAAGREGLVRRLSTDIHLGMNQRGVAAGQNRWSGLPIAVLIIVACINHTH